MKAEIKKAAAVLGYRLGLTQSIVPLGDTWKSIKGRGSFTVLIYHRVNDNGNPFEIDVVSTSVFEEQMRYLAKYFNVLAVDEVVEIVKSGGRLPERCVSVTFDDGYEDNFTCAFPVLRKYGLPATVFLTAGCIDRRESLWFDRVLYVFKNTSRSEAYLPYIGMRLPLGDCSIRVRSAIRVLYALMALPGQERLFQVDELFSYLGVERPSSIPDHLLTWEQIREMAEYRISSGSHTLTHPILSRITSDQAGKELIESKRLIEARTGHRVRVFAYPNGKPSDYSAETMDLLKNAGYTAALTTTPGVNFDSTGLYHLRRMRPWCPDIPSFALSLSCYNFLTK